VYAAGVAAGPVSLIVRRVEVTGVAKGEPLRAIGFWRDGIRPWRVPRGGWDAIALDRVVAYLASGHVLRAWLRGHLRCAFGCDFRPGFLPSYELTDGVWVWPMGLAHDVAEHGVQLLPSFVATAEAHGWTVPADLPVTELRERAAIGYDTSAWGAWYRRHRRPWYTLW
jgi:hypothetical protein